jgi:hypothetical protein
LSQGGIAEKQRLQAAMLAACRSQKSYRLASGSDSIVFFGYDSDGCALSGITVSSYIHGNDVENCISGLYKFIIWD